jgi:hypothetical protein
VAVGNRGMQDKVTQAGRCGRGGGGTGACRIKEHRQAGVAGGNRGMQDR